MGRTTDQQAAINLEGVPSHVLWDSITRHRQGLERDPIVQRPEGAMIIVDDHKDIRKIPTACKNSSNINKLTL